MLRLKPQDVNDIVMLNLIRIAAFNFIVRWEIHYSIIFSFYYSNMSLKLKRPLKKLLFCSALLLILLPGLTRAQIIYIDTAGYSDLKKTTTLFLVPERDSTLRADFEQAISSAWKFTPYKIIYADQLPLYYNNPDYSYFCEIRRSDKSGAGPGYVGPVNGAGGLAGAVVAVAAVALVSAAVSSAVSQPVYFSQSKEGEVFKMEEGNISLYSFFTQRQDKRGNNLFYQNANIKIGLAAGKEFQEQFRRKHRKPGDKDTALAGPYWNPYWNPGLLKMYLTIINHSLETATGFRQYSNYRDTLQLKHLASDTLYIPDYLEGPLLRSASQDDSTKPDSVIAAVYPHPYRIVCSEELSVMLLHSPRPINFITCSTYGNMDIAYNIKERTNEHKKFPQSHLDRGIKIYNSEKGIIYAEFPHKHYMFKKVSVLTSINIEDLEDLAVVMKGGK